MSALGLTFQCFVNRKGKSPAPPPRRKKVVCTCTLYFAMARYHCALGSLDVGWRRTPHNGQGAELATDYQQVSAPHWPTQPHTAGGRLKHFCF